MRMKMQAHAEAHPDENMRMHIWAAFEEAQLLVENAHGRKKGHTAPLSQHQREQEASHLGSEPRADSNVRERVECDAHRDHRHATKRLHHLAEGKDLEQTRDEHEHEVERSCHIYNIKSCRVAAGDSALLQDCFLRANEPFVH